MDEVNFLKRLVLRSIELFKFYIFRPPIWVRNAPSCITLGSKYGKKILDISQLPDHPLVLSVGVGEDVSFDIEMINRFNARIILVDPTPRSVEYYKELLLGLVSQQQLAILIPATNQSPRMPLKKWMSIS